MTKDMTSGKITPLLINFTIPLVLGNLFQLTYNAADSIIVGKFVGEDALAAVGTANPLMTLAILFINGICLGAGILVSTAFGAGDTELVERQVSTTAIAGTVFSLAFSLLCILLANPLLRLLQVPAEILPIAVNYLRIVFAGLLFTFFYNFLAATLRALGDSKSALYFLMISAVLNIGGDLFFVEALDWGSEGCALSTVLSEGMCCLLCALYIRWKVPVLQLGRRWFVFDGKLLGKIGQHLQTMDGNDVVDAFERGETVSFDIDGTLVTLSKDDVLTSPMQKSGFVAQEDKGVTVVLDTNLTPELIAEGYVREVVSKVQTMRKESDFDVTDRVDVRYECGDVLASAIESGVDMLKRGTLAEVVERAPMDDTFIVRDWSINGQDCKLGVRVHKA